MRKFITIFLILFGLFPANGQTTFKQNKGRVIQNEGGYIIDRFLKVPPDTSSFPLYGKERRIAILNDNLYYFDSTNQTFKKVASYSDAIELIGDTSSLNGLNGLKLNAGSHYGTFVDSTGQVYIGDPTSGDVQYNTPTVTGIDQAGINLYAAKNGVAATAPYVATGITMGGISHDGNIKPFALLYTHYLGDLANPYKGGMGLNLGVGTSRKSAVYWHPEWEHHQTPIKIQLNRNNFLYAAHDRAYLDIVEMESDPFNYNKPLLRLEALASANPINNHKADVIQLGTTLDTNLAGVDKSFHFYSRGYRVTGEKTITTSTTTDTSASVYLCNTSGGSITLTLNTPASYTGMEYAVYKISSDDNTITLLPSSGTINGQASLTVTSGADIHYGADGNYSALSHSSSSANGYVLQASAYNMKADLKYADIVFNSSNTTVTSTGTFTQSDTGKVIVLPYAKTATEYSSEPQTLTAKIATYVDANTVTISKQPTNDGTADSAYFGTNNADVLQNVVTLLNNSGAGTLILDASGSYLVNYEYSNLIPLQTGKKGIKITAPLKIQGQGKGVTAIKFANEDINDTTYLASGSVSDYNLFVINGTGGYHFTDFDMVGPHRFTTQLSTARGAAIATEDVFNNGNTSVYSNCDITYDRRSPYTKYKRLAWQNGINVSTDIDSNNTSKLTIEDCEIYVNIGQVSMFGSNNGGKYFHINNVKLGNGGSPLMAEYAHPHASGSISASSNTLTISNWDVFSAYDLTTQRDEDNRKYFIKIWNTSGDTLTTKIASINSPKEVVLEDAATVNFSEDSIIFYATNVGEGHGMYLHPNVTQHIENTTVYNPVRWALHTYKSGATSGNADYRRIINSNTVFDEENYPYVSTTNGGWLTGNNQVSTGKVEISNCRDFRLNTYFTTPIEAKNTAFIGETIYNGGGTMYNCTGDFLFSFNDTTYLYDCHFEDINGNTGNGGVVYTYGGSSQNDLGQEMYAYGTLLNNILSTDDRVSITRNVADANTLLLLENKNGSSTGKGISYKYNGFEYFSLSRYGQATMASAVINGTINSYGTNYFTAANWFGSVRNMNNSFNFTSSGNTTVNNLTVSGSDIDFSALPVHADNAAAVTGGVATGHLYKTSTGDIKIVY